MGVDYATKLHERIGFIFRAVITDSSGQPAPGQLGYMYEQFPSYSWQFVFGPLLVAMGLFLVAFLLRHLPTPQLKGLMVVAIGMFAAAVGIDFLESVNSEIQNRVADVFLTTPWRLAHFSESIEEFLELAATTVLLFVFLKKLMSLTPSLTFDSNSRI